MPSVVQPFGLLILADAQADNRPHDDDDDEGGDTGPHEGHCGADQLPPELIAGSPPKEGLAHDQVGMRERAPIRLTAPEHALRAIIKASCWNSRCPSRPQNHPQNQYRASRRFAPLTSHPQPSRHCQIDEPEASGGRETYDRGWL